MHKTEIISRQNRIVKMVSFKPELSFKHFLAYVILRCVFSVCWDLKALPFLRSVIEQLFDTVSGIHLCPAVYWQSLFDAEMLEHVYHSLVADMTRKVKLGRTAINSPLVSTSGKTYLRLLDFAKGKRPLVVNFGSYSCPVFMKKLAQYQVLMQKYSDIADFVVIYIEEAHPTDGWMLKNNVAISSHRCQADRCSAATQMLQAAKLHCPVAVDTMLNAANIAYGAVPVRLYIIEEEYVVYEGGSSPMKYEMGEVENWLLENSTRIRRKSHEGRASLVHKAVSTFTT